MQLMHGDCLELMASIPDGSVDMVLTDPPYGTMKGLTAQAGMDGMHDWDTALKPSDFLEHCNRVLRMNGALVLFGQEPYTSRLITEAHGNLPFSYRMAWVKDNFANCLLAKKAPVSYFEDVLVFFKKYDTLAQHPLRDYSKQVLAHCGGDMKAINSQLGHRRAEHFFYVESTQFGLCTEETYTQLCDTFDIESQPWFMPFAELEAINRRFNLHDGKKFKSNILTYRKDYTGHHPTQKPVALLEDLLKTYSNACDTILDFTMGSGSTGVACANTGRKFIGIERDDKYFAISKVRIETAQAEFMTNQPLDPEDTAQAAIKDIAQLELA